MVFRLTGHAKFVVDLMEYGCVEASSNLMQQKGPCHAKFVVDLMEYGCVEASSNLMQQKGPWGYKLCIRWVGNTHLGQQCNHTRVCVINGCKEVHH